MKKSFLVLLVFVCLAAGGRVYAFEDSDKNGKLPDLWVDLSMGAPLVDLFNERAREDDIARVEHISQLDLLEGVTAGKKLVVFKSAADAIRLLPHIHDSIDIVGYNLEHGPANPVFEQENPVESIKQLREVTDQYGLELALGPDRRFAESDGAAMAPYADYFIFQVQKVQTEPETVYDYVEPLLGDIRRANPDIEISLQIRTEGDVDQLMDLLAPLAGEIQGISVLTSEETLSVTEEIMETLRPEINESLPEPEPEVFDEVDISQSLLTAVPPSNEEATAIASNNVSEQVEPDQDDSEAVEAQVVRPDEGPASTATEIISTPEATERTGSTYLFVVIALVVGFALGAGYVSHRTGL
ncbi:MAG: hypothetical protein ACK2U5_08895 [Candidatus Promineifilaceae bacterium]